MAKMRQFKFTNEHDEPIEGIEPIEETGFKRAVKSVQNKIKDKWVIIEYLTKKGKEVRRFVKLPIGRKKRLVR
jgi:ABC-type transporter Mla maintaining outer membrane lipid asymmetry ATPase subunit MlaF|tara:strand:+ start:546 stop:764 length:219 start_codon:yes stop_codon:yes gene_type:complete